MSDELEALNELRENLDVEGCLDFINEKRITDIKQALERIEAIDNAKPSKALEALEILKKHNSKSTSERYYYPVNTRRNAINIIKQALTKAQEQEKVLEIIKKKHISIWRFRNIVFGYEQKQNGNFVNDTYEYYKEHFGYYHEGFEFELLDEEEFELLKRWLENES